jgi:hypothetical protein
VPTTYFPTTTTTFFLPPNAPALPTTTAVVPTTAVRRAAPHVPTTHPPATHPNQPALALPHLHHCPPSFAGKKALLLGVNFTCTHLPTGYYWVQTP